MSNHAHLLVKTGTVPLSTMMARLLTGYAVSFNRRHRRHGQLFQNRYKFILCEEDPYFLELVCYIHLNPLRASLIPDTAALAKYPYAGHSALMRTIKRPWQDAKYVLSLFGTSAQVARSRYRRFVEKGVDQGKRADLTGGGLQRSYGGWQEIKKGRERLKGDERILRSSDFAQTVLARTEEQLRHSLAVREAGHTLRSLTREIGQLFGITERDLLSRTKERCIVEGRSLLCYVAVTDLGMSATDPARVFGMTQPAITYSVRRGREVARQKGYTLGKTYNIASGRPGVRPPDNPSW
jgi:hypothetical protein